LVEAFSLRRGGTDKKTQDQAKKGIGRRENSIKFIQNVTRKNLK
jgi:hypothetical protein